MKLSDFLYNLDEFYVRSQEQNLPVTVSKEWDILYNKYQDFNEPFLQLAGNPNARDNGVLVDLMREILIFVLDNFRYFNYCFAYDIEQRRAICPRLTVANYDVILDKLIRDYIIFEEEPEIVNIVFDKDATIAKADGNTILVATLSNDDELTFYVENSGEIAFIEENGIDAFDSLMGVYDNEIQEFYNNNIDEILNTFDEMERGDVQTRTFLGIHGETWTVELMNFANLIPNETKVTFKCTREEYGNVVYVSFLNGEYFENYDEDEDVTDIVDNTRLMDELESWANEFDFKPIDTREKLKKSNNKKSIPSNVLEWCKDGNGYHVFDEVKKLATWLNKLTGRNFVGGTSIGKSPQTLILDITYQGSEVYVNSGSIKFKNEIVENYKEFKTVFEKHFKLIN